MAETRRGRVVGETVQYLPPGEHTYSAAIVTAIDAANGDLSLFVLRPEWNSTSWVDSVKEGSTPGTWRTLAAARVEPEPKGEK